MKCVLITEIFSHPERAIEDLTLNVTTHRKRIRPCDPAMYVAQVAVILLMRHAGLAVNGRDDLYHDDFRGRELCEARMPCIPRAIQKPAAAI